MKLIETDQVAQLGREMYRFERRSDLFLITTPIILFRLANASFESAMFAMSNASSPSNPMIATYVNNTANTWKVLAESKSATVVKWIVYFVHAATVLLAAIRLYGFLNCFGPQFSIPQVCISLELIHLFRTSSLVNTH